MNKKFLINFVIIFVYFLFLVISYFYNFEPGREIGRNFISFSVAMLKIIPCTFILIGLFEVWVKRETIEKHLGEDSGFRAYFWMIILASTAAGGLLVALPVAYTLFNKGAKLSVIFTYVGAATICRIPMTLFEASFLGMKFTLIRWSISIPLVIISSILLGGYLTKRNYKILKGK